MVERILVHLVERADGEMSAWLAAELAGLSWLPAADRAAWLRPGEVFTVFNSHLFASVGPFLELLQAVQQKAGGLLGQLGVRSRPPVELIVAHLRESGRTGTPVHEEVFRTLNDNCHHVAVSALCEIACIELDDGRFAVPDAVIWRHPFGRFCDHPARFLRRYPDFCDTVGVKQEATPEDALRVLERFARSYPEGTRVDAPDVTVLNKCWSMLDEALAAHTLEDSISALSRRHCLTDGANNLREPVDLYFNDAPVFAEVFANQIGLDLIDEPRVGAQSMRHAGVQDLSNAVTVSISDLGEALDDGDIISHIAERRSDLLRVAQTKGPAALERAQRRLTQLRVECASDLSVEYQLVTLASTATVVRSVPAYFDSVGDTLCVVGNAKAWEGIALALGQVMLVAPPPSLCALIAVVLSAPTAGAATATLDMFGVPPLTSEVRQHEWEEGPHVGPEPRDFVMSVGETAADSESDPLVELDGPGPYEAGACDVPGHQQSRQQATTAGMHQQAGKSPTAGVAGVTGPFLPNQADVIPQVVMNREGVGASAVDSPAPVELTAGPNRTLRSATELAIDQSEPKSGGRQRRMRSYVSLLNGNSNGTTRDHLADLQIDRAGIRRVMEFESSRGRSPEKKAHSHPGFDIESYDGGSVRYIEVKSMRDDWGERGAAMSHTQFFEAKRQGKNFWLYIVERAERDDFGIWRIQDPASRVEEFWYDDGWKAGAAAEEEVNTEGVQSA